MDSKNEICARCGNNFGCKQGQIAACDCTRISLSAGEYKYIQNNYSTCLCNTCLTEMKAEYSAKNPLTDKTGNTTLLLMFLFLVTRTFSAQVYPPPVGQAGTTAIHKDSSAFVAWATGCRVTRGFQDISNPGLGLTTVGDSSMAFGKAQANGVVSLGDRGVAICTFPQPIKNGQGFDFAVFENSIDDTFLELAFVEVSSDGINYFRFPAHSLTDTTTQTSSFGSTDATKLNNLAGKYRSGYGTPFDLQELSGTVGLNIDQITHVKIVDVVGSISNAYASLDSYQRKVNDPWPTAFPSGGFDLDAVGVIHQNTITGVIDESVEPQVEVFPNPASLNETITVHVQGVINSIDMIDPQGGRVGTFYDGQIATIDFTAGLYFLKISCENKVLVKKIIIQ